VGLSKWLYKCDRDNARGREVDVDVARHGVFQQIELEVLVLKLCRMIATTAPEESSIGLRILVHSTILWQLGIPTHLIL